MRLLVALQLLLLFAVGDAAVAAAGDEPEQPDAVRSLPGYAAPLQEWVNMSAGFITVNNASGRRLFYTLVKSRRDPLNDPLILWLQGGPGCSSMGAGFWTELGPFHLVGGPLGSGERLVPNNFTWAQTANLVFLESPAFTGFSTSDNEDDRDTNDQRVTSDHVAFLQQLVKRHAFLRSADLYLAGESYAGHYLPLLAAKLLAKKAQPLPTSDPPTGGLGLNLQLRGIIAGNPWTSPQYDNQGAVEWWYGQGLISRATHDGLLNNCQLSKGALWRTEGPNGLTQGCNAWRDRAYQEIGGINLYALNAPVCMAPADATDLPPGAPLAGNPSYDPCAGRRIEAYMNRLDVQQALNVVPVDTPASLDSAASQLVGRGGQQQQQQQQRQRQQGASEGQGNTPVALPWRRCVGGANLKYAAASIGSSVEQMYPALVRAGIQVLLLSGNEDGYVPTRGTRAWIESLGRLQLLDPKVPLQTWQDRSTGQVGGFVTSYRARTAGSDDGTPASGTPEVTLKRLGRKGELRASHPIAHAHAHVHDLQRHTFENGGQEEVEELIRAVEAATGGMASAKEALGQLHFVVVLNAGHAVPVFQPSAALQLLQAYLSGEPLA